MSRVLKYDLLLASSLAVIYYLFVVLAIYFPGLKGVPRGAAKSIGLDFRSLMIFIGLLLWAIPCVIVAVRRKGSEGDRFMLFWTAGLAFFFLARNSLVEDELLGPPVVSLAIFTLSLMLGWVFYIFRYARRKVEIHQVIER
jgi:hypothetical protein